MTIRPMPAPGLAERVQKTMSDYASLLRPMSLLVLFAAGVFICACGRFKGRPWLQVRRRSTSRSSPRWLGRWLRNNLPWK